MRGFVPTPPTIVDLMVEMLFEGSCPDPRSRLLDAGCGPGAFISGVRKWLDTRDCSSPSILGMELNPALAQEARTRFEGVSAVEIREGDFLEPRTERYDYVIGNPPYVPITELTPTERDRYRARYVTARERFDLYLLFFEQALSVLKPTGRLVFITPEKFLYTSTAAPLRKLLAERGVKELRFLPEDTFGELVTYPLITVVPPAGFDAPTRITDRNGQSWATRFPKTSDSWLPSLRPIPSASPSRTLGEICSRISCGIATGADSVFTIRSAHLDSNLRDFAFPTLAGRHIRLGHDPKSMHSLLVPYRREGGLLKEEELGPLGEFLAQPGRREKLLARTCVARKPWYAFHENPPLNDILRPKLLCKDITSEPFFVVDRRGDIVPRHSVYYIVPNDPNELDAIAVYLNSPRAVAWLKTNCQRAAKGYIRLQSNILKRLPVPPRLLQVRPSPSQAFVA